MADATNTRDPDGREDHRPPRARGHRHPRQDGQDPPGRGPAAGPPPEVRQVRQAADHLLRPRREERVAPRRHGRDHRDAGRCRRRSGGSWSAIVTKAPSRTLSNLEGAVAGSDAAARARRRPKRRSNTQCGVRSSACGTTAIVCDSAVRIRTPNRGSHDPDVYVPGRGRQHRGQGSDVHQGARRHASAASPTWATSSSPASRRRSPAAT